MTQRPGHFVVAWMATLTWLCSPTHVEAQVLSTVSEVLVESSVMPDPYASSECYQAPSAPVVTMATGLATSGALVGGLFVNPSATIRHVDTQHCAYWGTPEIVGLVERVAAAVAEVSPGARLAVGELSAPGGGAIDGHSSHQNGRDVDLGFYFLDRQGRPAEPGRLIDVRRNGTARWKNQTFRFDAPRNWRMVEALITDAETDVEFLLVNTRIRTMILNEARRQRVPRPMRDRAARMMMIPRRREHPHLNHFHVRIFCVEGAAECTDGRPLWEWTVAARGARRDAQAVEATTLDAAIPTLTL